MYGKVSRSGELKVRVRGAECWKGVTAGRERNDAWSPGSLDRGD